MTSKKTACIGLGSNLGDRESLLCFAFEQIFTESLGQIIAISNFYETEPVGGPEQPDYLNALCLLETDLTAVELLTALLCIEEKAGRERKVRWGARRLDLDLLYIEQEVQSTDTPIHLELPHPRMHLRQFVLRPMSELCPEWKHPILCLNVRELLVACPDKSSMIVYDPQCNFGSFVTPSLKKGKSF